MTRTVPPDHDHALATRAIHAGQRDDPLSGAVMTPIYQTSTYRQEGIGKHKGYEYARTQNPTREALERNVAALEGAAYGFAFGSGLAALDALLKLFRPGDHVVSTANLYGGSHRLMTRVFEPYGLQFAFVDSRDPARVEQAMTPATRLLYCETPTNPMMFLTDLRAMGDLAAARGVLFAVDNTFATPVFQRPVESGCEVVLPAARVQAAAETYIGLVETGVGLIPAGGGTTEMVRRAAARIPPGTEADPSDPNSRPPTPQ